MRSTGNAHRRGYIWTAGHFEDVIVPGATDTCVFGINAPVWIAGSYIDTEGKEHGSQTKM
jgi:hypothetical protein